ncbi:MAG: bacillithiol biosynthesis deacetylase BshB1 [Chitinophagales bacterium]|nr:bacillithiol biosynthesis deacetylase BshB1 [Chitinophagales bacterium]
MKLDILAIGIHPDDVELSCGGTVAKHVSMGYQVGILDLTKGELGTRGSVAARMKEAASAAKILGVTIRENLGFEDGFSVNDKAHQMEIIKILRKYQPDIVLTNAPHDRHPDHGKAAQMTYDACFLSGLSKIITTYDGDIQKCWRPRVTYNYIQGRYIEPDLVVDTTPFFEQKMEAIMAYSSQFYNPNSTEPATFISDPSFLDLVKSKDVIWGKSIGVRYAEGFIKQRYIGVDDLTKLI